VVVGLVGIGVAGQTTDISGTWNLSVDVDGTKGTPTVVLEQQGSTLTGTVTNPRGRQRVTGTVKGNQAVFGFETTREGQPFKASYRGTIDSPRRMTGEVEFSGALSGTGTWVATKE
jgi:hypothetical protein